MKLAIIDDDKRELLMLSEYLTNQLKNLCTILCFHNGEDFLATWKRGDYDLIILDIYMDKLLGVEVARKIRETDPDVLLAFCTSSNEFAEESYEVNARYYMRKPITVEKVKNLLARLRLSELELSRMLTLPDGQNIILRNIIYAEYLSRTLTIHSKVREDITVRMLFSEAEKLFSEYSYFCVCSKGIIVNFYEVSAIHDDVFIMASGISVPISRRKSKEVTDAYAAFRFEELRKDRKE